MLKPRISVLIDTYNHERFIEHAVNSVLAQDMSMDEVEIVVVDDGSTDRTPEIVDSFAPRVRLLRKPNGGQASAFNFALPQTQGDIIAMLDGDDWWAPEKLRRAVETLDAHPEVGIVGHGYIEVYADERSNRLVLPGKQYRLDLHSKADAEVFRHLAAFLGTSKMTIRRAILDRILPIPAELGIEADEYIFTLAPALAPAIILNEPLFFYGFHGGNLFQFQEYNPAKVTRKMRVLEVLLREVPPRLRELGVEKSAIAALLSGTGVEAERMRLSVEGGSPLRSFAVERKAYRLAYSKVSWRHRVFQCLVLAQTLVLPPRTFYRMRRWYAAKGLARFRRWTGKPVPAVPLVERHPEA